MTKEISLPLSMEPIEPLIGFQVMDAWIGVGTFLVLDLATSDSMRTGKLWIYLADWAIVAGGEEVRASETLAENREERLPVDELIGRHLTAATRQDDEELHLEFSQDAHLEIWENRTAYGVGAELLHIFRDGEKTVTLTFPQPSIH